MAARRASLASASDLRSSASMEWPLSESVDSGELQVGQRLAKPGLSGFSSNSSSQTMQTLMGKAIELHDTTLLGATEDSESGGAAHVGWPTLTTGAEIFAYPPFTIGP